MDPARRTILRDAAGVGLAVGVYGVSFGVLAVAAGASVAQAMALSLLVFTGASQFAFVGVIAGGGSAAAAVAPALMLAARNGIYGLSLAPVLTGTRVARLLQSHLVIDETPRWRARRTRREHARTAFLFTGLSVLLCWNAGTLAGALTGGGIGDPRDLGMDAMFPAAFLALLSPQLRRPGAPRAAVTGALIAAALVASRRPGIPIVAAIGALVPAGARRPAHGGARELGGDPRARGGLLRAEGARDGAGRRSRDPPAGARAARPGAGPAARRADPDPDGDHRRRATRSTRGCPRSVSPALLVWRRAPFLVVVLAAAATAALLRAV